MGSAILLLLFSSIVHCATPFVDDVLLDYNVSAQNCENVGCFACWPQGSKNSETETVPEPFPCWWKSGNFIVLQPETEMHLGHVVNLYKLARNFEDRRKINSSETLKLVEVQPLI